MKIVTPPEKSHPHFPSNQPLKVEVRSSPPFLEIRLEAQPPPPPSRKEGGCTLWLCGEFHIKLSVLGLQNILVNVCIWMWPIVIIFWQSSITDCCTLSVKIWQSIIRKIQDSLVLIIFYVYIICSLYMVHKSAHFPQANTKMSCCNWCNRYGSNLYVFMNQCHTLNYIQYILALRVSVKQRWVSFKTPNQCRELKFD